MRGAGPPSWPAYIPGCDADLADQAARLAKADLVSGMVGEFPELQGIMGRYYARDEGLPDDVADAIADHYKPLGPDRSLSRRRRSASRSPWRTRSTAWSVSSPSTRSPTGSKDPFALRRAALGVIRLILENGCALKLRDVFGFAYSGFYDQGGFEQNQPQGRDRPS